jgi:hypothetical protein
MLGAGIRSSMVLVLALAACHPTAPNSAAAAVTLRDLQNGDRACYVVVEKADGSREDLEGDFDLCAGGGHDATAMIGKRIRYTTRAESVLAASCEGNVDCGASDQVDLVVTLDAAP